MEIARIQIRINPPKPPHHESFIQELHHCPLCNSELHLSHTKEPAKMAMNEEAHCPSCLIRIRAEEYPLQ